MKIKYIDYIEKHKSEIKPKETSISSIYMRKPEWISWIREITTNADLQSFIDELEREGFNKIITRQDVFDMFDKNLYKGFVYSMLWGGIGFIDKNNLVNAFSTPKDDIVRKLSNVKRMIDHNDLQNAFNTMLNANKRNNNKIKGVGVSYLTKLLFFLCDDNNPKNEKTNNNRVLPLIYDSKGLNMHAALLIDKEDNEKLLKCKYLSINEYNGKGESFTDYEIYNDYLLSINEIAKSLKKMPGDIEEFLFGYAKDKHNKRTLNPETNPRVFAELYIQKYCDHLIDKKPNKKWEGISENELNSQTNKKNKKGRKNNDSVNKNSNEQNHREGQPSERDFTKDINTFKKQYPNLNAVDSRRKLSGNRKVFWGFDLDEDLLLYVGKNSRGIYCSIYSKEGTLQELEEKMSDLLPSNGKDWIAKYCTYEEAVNTLDQVLDRLQERKD